MNDNRGLWRGKTLLKTNPEEAFNNVWVQGDLIEANDKKYIHPKTNDVKVSDTDLGKFIVMHEVIPKTLGECTGIPVLDDLILFEGDIVKTGYGTEIVVGVVEYDKYLGAFILNDGVYDYMFGSDITGDECEVIGNVHDNPELLKGADI